VPAPARGAPAPVRVGGDELKSSLLFDPADVAWHDKMVALVERMLALHKKLVAATIPADKELYRRQVAAVDQAD
jgi:hypothetical protein